MGTFYGDATRFDTSTLDDVLERRRAEMAAIDQKDRESWAKVAVSLGVYPSVISAILSGKRQPGPKLLRRLGLRRVVSYEKVAS